MQNRDKRVLLVDDDAMVRIGLKTDVYKRQPEEGQVIQRLLFFFVFKPRCSSHTSP